MQQVTPKYSVTSYSKLIFPTPRSCKSTQTKTSSNNIHSQQTSTPPSSPTSYSSKLDQKTLESIPLTLFTNKIASFLSETAKKYSTTRINNDVQSLKSFINEITKRSKSKRNILLLATYYFQKLYTSLSTCPVSTIPEFAFCAKRSFLTCIIIAHKYLNDSTFSMESWSLISGLNKKALSTIERWCLGKLDYNLFVDDLQFGSWQRKCLFQLPQTANLLNKKRSAEVCVADDIVSMKRLHC
ncbi:cyclin family protein NDAI_0C04300 [Naumovozyma dairenensis CBS 421]|uniref:Cyclin N-terminal domain-containing protein n=1 Tax=Naumovozyma dairenensis (strain ATCC 10597 / BCRC 20456 / CBS 421 / NBRC 0211 / NRRL Y-12639) TaxID=1071378 RepID=G0W8H9_NAUDC|nr:hypothetical protein NDAI_0C04300 [Naumovozyma dairenensis CBS 421]CCD24090.1 hypothetical protein NDAI_0C04300 [Naumovozyma dairenensis CBS 421]